MKYTVQFKGTEEARTNQAWKEILSYLGDRQKQLGKIKKEVQTEGSEERSKKTARLVGMFWGIEGHYTQLALKEFFMGTRKLLK